ncbi:Methyl-accepting chemotaxis protein [Bifidobacterium eulemuris]|uniref:Methyl-accepting chemotaxis protein n=3 Tax=Bifidobacterium eulemuris TaxID=1765219 RepID=A0A261G2J5_9BIFI|nr:Methyl-accepting chemotaxis protein [Bifidobacterium eulemuris]
MARMRTKRIAHARALPRKKHTTRRIVLAFLLLVIVVGGCCGFMMFRSAMSAKNHLNNVIATAQSLNSGDMTDALTNIGSSVESIQTEAAAAKQDVSGPLWTAAEWIPVVGSDISSVRSAVNTLDDFAQTTLPQLQQAVNTLTGSSLSDGDGGLNMEPIITAADQLTVANDSLAAQAQTINDLPDAKIGLVQDALSKGKTQLTAVADTVNQLTGIVNMLPSFLGTDGARNYVLLAQTNSEIRGAGGMVGSVGSFSADNGKISVGEFHSNTQFSGNATDQIGEGESTLYSDMYFGTAIHNITSSPDFPQVARMASEFWEQQSFGGTSDGVMSLDPVALQAMIGATGSVTLSDGRVLDGTNTADFLLNGVYLEVSVEEQDTYFSETASQVIANMFTNMDSTKMMNLAKALMNMAGQRHFYFWSFHDEDVETLRDAGMTGEINNSESDSTVGLYLNEMYASKLDYYVDRHTVVEQTGTNADGSATYHVTTTLTNTMTAALNATVPWYINHLTPDGTAGNRTMIFAPTGGTVSNITASNGAQFTQVDAYDRTVYLGQLDIPVETTITLEWDVTTQAGADPLQIDQTPTCSDDPGIEYRY